MNPPNSLKSWLWFLISFPVIVAVGLILIVAGLLFIFGSR